MRDDRTRPWRKLRVVVEVTVPPNSRATEKDLAYHVGLFMSKRISLPRPQHADAYAATTRIKMFSKFWPVFLRMEKGLKVGRPKEKKS